MKKAINRTIIVLIVINLITAGFTLAQDVIEEENQEVLEKQMQEADLAQRKTEAEFAAQEAQKEVEIAEKEVQAAAKMAEKQAEIARKQMKAAGKQAKDLVLKQMDLEQKVKDLMVDIQIPNVTLPHLPHFQRSGSGGVLVIPSAEMKVENLAVITEDMSVMSRIFDKQLNQSNVQTARGRMYGDFNPFFGRGNRTTEAIFLEGYGALFLMEINILLSAPPETQQKEKTKEDTDPVWSQMRREMYEPEETRRSRTDDRPKEKYDAEMVETLKTNLIKTLKHATNIQALEPEQLVILTVIGDRHQSAATVTRTSSYGRRSGSRYRTIVQTAPEAETGPLPPTVLTISAKKSDIDAFAKGELDYDQFRQRTGIFKSYAKAGQNNSPGADEHQVAHEIHR
ncbi:MAG: hypothetical protein HQ580_11060 [Planctomycetes bacterium]|nr:hypothetical protein [Planctomycetota bacterium]